MEKPFVCYCGFIIDDGIEDKIKNSDSIFDVLLFHGGSVYNKFFK